MRILHYIISTAAWVGGPSRVVLDTARMMAHGTSAGPRHHVTILACDTSSAPLEWLDPRHHRCLASPSPSDGTPPSLCVLGTGSRYRRFLGRSDLALVKAHLRHADVLHLHGVFEPSNLQVAAAARRLGVPYVVTTHGMLDDWCMGERTTKKRAFLKLLGNRFLRGASRLHLTAQAELDQSRKWFGDAPTFIAPYLFDLEPFRQLPGPDEARHEFEFLRQPGPPILLFLSRVHYKKGPEHLIRAAALLKERNIPIRVAIAGMGDQAYLVGLQRLIDDLGVQQSVRLIGPVVGPLKLSLYQLADLFVLPTSQENLGLVLIESLACGTPLVTTKGVDIWKDLVNANAGVVSDADAPQLASTIQSLLADPARLKSMGERGRAWVLETFDHDRLVRRYEQFYESCIAQRKSDGNSTARPKA